MANIRAALLASTERLIRRMALPQWDVWAVRLARLAREEQAGSLKIVDVVSEWTDAYCTMLQKIDSSVDNRTVKDAIRFNPVLVDGHIQLLASHLLSYIEVVFREKLTARELGLRLRQAGWEHSFIAAGGGRSLRVWQRPHIEEEATANG